MHRACRLLLLGVLHLSPGLRPWGGSLGVSSSCPAPSSYSMSSRWMTPWMLSRCASLHLLPLLLPFLFPFLFFYSFVHFFLFFLLFSKPSLVLCMLGSVWRFEKYQREYSVHAWGFHAKADHVQASMYNLGVHEGKARADGVLCHLQRLIKRFYRSLGTAQFHCLLW